MSQVVSDAKSGNAEAMVLQTPAAAGDHLARVTGHGDAHAAVRHIHDTCSEDVDQLHHLRPGRAWGCSYLQQDQLALCMALHASPAACMAPREWTVWYVRYVICLH